MASWSREKERRAAHWHLRRCRFCRALRSHSLRRGDVHLLDAAGALVDEHAENDADHKAFADGFHSAHRRTADGTIGYENGASRRLP